MMPTVTVIFVALALLATIASAWQPTKLPLWVAVLFVVLVEMLMVLPK